MKILVNVFHPQLATSRVNRRWVEALENHDGIHVNKPYEHYPDWNIDVAFEQSLLLAHDRIVFQHPFWWYSTPPLMKKWLDDVLTYGWAYGPGGVALQGKDWVSAISSGGPADSYQSGGYNNYSMSELLKPLQQTANLIGMKFLPPFILHGTVQISPEAIDVSASTYLDHICNPVLDPHLRLARLLDKMKSEGQELNSGS
ncbi:MAG: NAD(P)H-dependent oxidoreductase [Burkholderiales bacterium]|nr:NAD(P)H-dependent oxidoreductase [Burkholderiales bacterium]MCA3153954.1 NAD(P)H-dependent oxidoreductase [Burkholderiales bacterium]MCA3157644.1 NAD(P)H-dependent oxidoreductase [Burkholderiales bacterium]MCA3168710.1 NAD(P)H-dependent oxidoreductase [Burkholderiales bacterium]